MTFEEWFEQQKNNLNPKASEKLDQYEPEFRRVWNGALDQVSNALEIHDTIGDIKYEVNERLRS